MEAAADSRCHKSRCENIQVEEAGRGPIRVLLSNSLGPASERLLERQTGIVTVKSGEPQRNIVCEHHTKRAENSLPLAWRRVNPEDVPTGPRSSYQIFRLGQVPSMTVIPPVADVIRFDVDPHGADAHGVLEERIPELRNLGGEWLAVVSGARAGEEVRVDVGVASCDGVLVCGDEVGIYSATCAACFEVASDHGLGEAFGAGFDVCGYGN